jgi:O-glycosyl hydrolase
VALHTNNNATIKIVAPHCYACQQRDNDNYDDKKKQRKKERKKK